MSAPILAVAGKNGDHDKVPLVSAETADLVFAEPCAPVTWMSDGRVKLADASIFWSFSCALPIWAGWDGAPPTSEAEPSAEGNVNSKLSAENFMEPAEGPPLPLSVRKFISYEGQAGRFGSAVAREGGYVSERASSSSFNLATLGQIARQDQFDEYIPPTLTGPEAVKECPSEDIIVSSSNLRTATQPATKGATEAALALVALLLLAVVAKQKLRPNPSLDSLVKSHAQVRERAEMLAIIGHEIKSPLGGLVLAAEHLSKDPSLEKNNALIARQIELSGARLISQLDDILLFLRLDCGKLKLNIQEFLPVSIIETVLAAHKHRAETAGLNIRLCETTYQQIVVKLDRERFAQIICNIVGNSILHSHGSELVISMKVTHDTFSVRLKDNGVGISAQNQRLALQKFEQLRSSCQTSSRDYSRTVV